MVRDPDEPKILTDRDQDEESAAAAAEEPVSASAPAREPTPGPASDPTPTPTPTPTPRAATATAARDRRAAPTVYVVGFWKRALAALIDFTIVIPVALLVTLIASKVSGVGLPPSNLRLVDLDMWIDLALDTDPSLVMGLVLSIAIGLTYLLVSHIVLGQTVGMRLLKLRIIDVYGERPSPARCVARCAGYLASAATLFLGFLWMGFDSEKRGLQDWIAGTYVIRA